MRSLRLSVHVLVRNGTAVLGRALRPLAGIASEICLVDDCSSDGTADFVHDLCRRELSADFCRVSLSPQSHPDLYFTDEPAAFGRALPCGHSGAPLLRDWSRARNLGLSTCEGDYVLKLDADDEVMHPENLLPSLDYLDAHPGVDVLVTPYEVMDPKTGEVAHETLYTRLWRNRPEIRFREVCHENVDWWRRPDGSNWRCSNNALLFRDHRDSPGDGVRVPARNFKVLLLELERARAAGEQPSPHVLIYLAQEAAEIDPLLALQLSCEVAVAHPGDLAWVHAIRGEALERLGTRQLAESAYLRAAELFPRAGLRAAVLRAERGFGQWRTCLAVALSSCGGKPYPRGPSVKEICRAQELLNGLT